MTELQAMMQDTHPYVPLYKQAFQIMRAKPPEQQKNVIVNLHMQMVIITISPLWMRLLLSYLEMAQRTGLIIVT